LPDQAGNVKNGPEPVQVWLNGCRQRVEPAVTAAARPSPHAPPHQPASP